VSLVLEHEGRSVPISLSTAVWLRWATVPIVICAILAVLFEGVLHKTPEMGNSVAVLLGPTFRTLIHLAYLYLVFWLLIFNRPPEELYKQPICFAVLLWLCYMIYLAAGYVEYANIYNQTVPFFGQYSLDLQKILGGVSQFAFLILYLLWFERDRQEFYSTSNLGRKGEIRLWWLIELIGVVLIGGKVGAYLNWWHLSDMQKWMFDKDCAIGLSLLAWTFQTVFKRDWENKSYRSYYEGYLVNNEAVSISSLPFLAESGTKIACVLDFGCGNGRRLDEILAWLGRTQPKDEDLEIIGCDKDGSWQAPFKAIAKGRKISFVTNWQEVNLGRVDLLVLSHVLYEPHTVAEVVRLIQRCRSGTLVVIRGMSPRSFFAAASAAFSLRLFRPTISHLWHRHQRERLVRKAGLKPVYQRLGDAPDGEVQQAYKLTEDSIDKARDLLGYLYGRIPGETIRRFFTDLRDRGATVEVSNNDLLYLYRKQ
jgi:SAM-dependent methyltransferase